MSELAKQSGVSRSMLHKIEQGQSSPTAVLLGKLSGAFGLSISTLMARAEVREGKLLRSGEQPVWTDPETGYIRRHISPRSDMPLDLVTVGLPPGANVPMPASAYTFLRQLIWVTKGTLVFEEGDTRHRMETGDCLELGPPTNCVFRNESEEPCEYLVAALTVS